MSRSSKISVWVVGATASFLAVHAALAAPPRFCASLQEFSASSTSYLAAQRETALARETLVVRNVKEERERADGKRFSARAAADAARHTELDGLVGKATRTPDRNALRTFRDRLGNAVAAERAASDSALLAFRDSIDELLAKRDRATAAAREKFEKALAAALAAAKKSCAKPSLANKAATAAEKSYREAEQAYRANLAAVGIESAVREREAELRRQLAEASENFGTAVAATHVELRATLGR